MNRPNYALAKVFFVVLRGPSWIIKGVPPRPSRTAQIMTLQRFSSRPFAAFRGQKGVLRSPSSIDQIMTLQWCSPWPFVDHKRCSPPPFVNRPNYALANLSSDKRQRALVTPPVRGSSLSTIHYPLSPTPCSSPYPLPQDKGRFLRRTGGCGTVQPVWAVIHLVRVTGLIPPPRTT